MKLSREARLRALGSQPVRPGDHPMRVDNQTRWNTRDLRALFSACCAAHFASSDRRVLIIAARRRRASTIHDYDRDEQGKLLHPPSERQYELGLAHGRAYVSSRWIRMSIPDDPTFADWRRVAQVFEHELWHNLGLRHADMPDWWTLPVLWATPELLAVRRRAERAEPPAPSRDERAAARRAEKLRRAELAVATWARKAKLAATKLRQWKRRHRAAERSLAANPKAVQP